MTTTASRAVPGRHDAICTFVVKLSSATRLSPSPGQPKPTRASLLTDVPGTVVSRPLVTDATSSSVANAPPFPPEPELTWSARNPPPGLNAPLAAEGLPGQPCHGVAACRQVQHPHQEQRGAHRFGVQAISLELAAITRVKERPARVAAGSHSV